MGGTENGENATAAVKRQLLVFVNLRGEGSPVSHKSGACSVRRCMTAVCVFLSSHTHTLKHTEQRDSTTTGHSCNEETSKHVKYAYLPTWQSNKHTNVANLQQNKWPIYTRVLSAHNT